MSLSHTETPIRVRPVTPLGNGPETTYPGGQSIAIIGGGLGGLSAAIYLRTAGYEITIFEANEKVGGRANQIEAEGYKFDTGPSLLNYPWIFEDLFKAAGRNLQDYVTLLPVDPSVSFQWPDGTTFQLSSTLPRLLDECDRIAPGSRQGLLAFLQDAERKFRLTFDKLVNRNEDRIDRWLGSLSLADLKRTAIWRSLDQELKRFFKSRHLREAFGAYGMYLGGTPYELPGIFSILPYGELAHGLWLPKGGVYGLIEGITCLARELGIVIRTGTPIKKIRTDNNRVVGLEKMDGEMMPYDLIVSNVDVPTTESKLLDHKKTWSDRQKQASKLKMTPGVMTFYWGIKGKVSGLNHHTIFLPEQYAQSFDELVKKNQIPHDLPFYVSVPSETDPDLAPPGNSAMFVLVPTPVLSKMPDFDWAGAVGSIKARVLKRLEQHQIHIQPEDIEFEEVYTPEDWQNRFGLFDGSAFGAAHTLMQVGPFRSRNYSKHVEGLYYVGASTTPGTGMPMVVLSGKLTMERIQARVHQT